MMWRRKRRDLFSSGNLIRLRLPMCKSPFQALLFLMHEGDGRLMFVGQVHEMNLGSLLGGKVLAEDRHFT
jgi:hypothetical protein